MKLILTHIGSDLPGYTYCCWRQIRVFNPDIEVIMIMGEKYIDKHIDVMSKYNIVPIPYESLEDDENVIEFNKLSWFKAWGKPNTLYPSPENFVHGTSARLFYLNAFLKKNKLNDIFHIENDIMLYGNLAELNFQDMFDDFVATKVGPAYMSCALVYIAKYQHMQSLCDFYLSWMRLGNEEIMRRNKHIEMVHEMTLLTIYENIQYIPALPDQDNFDKIGILFDPASWGQFLGGTNNAGNTKGWAGSHHYIGEQIITGNYSAYFRDGVPTVINLKTNETYELFNLHIHCKRLEEFLTCKQAIS